jgi:glutamate racemase
MQNRLPIGIFDSGLGGLTVAAEILRALPDEGIIYFGDTARCPYGPRPGDEVRSFVLQIGRWLAGQQVKLIVVACNTASAAGLALAQRTFDVPVLGVVEPGARAAVMATVNRRVGVIGTVGTIASGAYEAAVHALDAGIAVISVPAPAFVDVVEKGLRAGEGIFETWLDGKGPLDGQPSFAELASAYLDPPLDAGIDSLVLGCTHFPLLERAIARHVGPKVRLISSAEETAREVAEALGARGQLARPGEPRTEVFATTGDAAEFHDLGSRVLGRTVSSTLHVPVATLEALADNADRPAMPTGEGRSSCG